MTGFRRASSVEDCVFRSPTHTLDYLRLGVSSVLAWADLGLEHQTLRDGTNFLSGSFARMEPLGISLRMTVSLESCPCQVTADASCISHRDFEVVGNTPSKQTNPKVRPVLLLFLLS